MEQFATTALMEDRSQGEITLATHPYLDRELKAASRTIRGAAGWHIATVETLTYRRIGRFPWLCFLPAMQIQSLVSASVNGVSIDTNLIEWDSETGQTNLYGRAIEVTYTAGFPTIPEDVEQLCLELAAGALGVALGVTRETAGSVSVSMARDGGGLSLADLDRLAPYRLGPVP